MAWFSLLASAMLQQDMMLSLFAIYSMEACLWPKQAKFQPVGCHNARAHFGFKLLFIDIFTLVKKFG